MTESEDFGGNVAKKIDLSTGRSFKNIAEAKRHFTTLLDTTPLMVEISGSDLEDVNAVYRAYCDATEWELPSAPISFFPVHESGKGYTTRCFGVKFKMVRPVDFPFRKR
ncbi:MAG: hypothetical protein ABF809_02235 [Gluconobacter potus]|uniref:hypothetical protein n=1 Tax=Gluconobacter TaxID=441 RepID=UPI0018D20432|nr:MULTISPECIES: hypothetical protein [unclassified Gluconobacter]